MCKNETGGGKEGREEKNWNPTSAQLFTSCVRCLILQINLNGDAQIDGKILFLCISVRISLEELKIWIHRVNTPLTNSSKHHPTHDPNQCRWALSNPPNRTKKQSQGTFYSLLLNWDTHFFPSIRYLTPGSQVFGLKLGCIALAKLLQSCPTLCDPIDGSPPGSPIPGILQARTLEWVAISFSNAWKWKVKVKSLSRVRLLATLWTAAYQAPPSMGFSRQEYWSGVPLPSPHP